MTELKPCPFCGSKADLEDHRLSCYAICLLELRDRVVALESRQRPSVSAEVRPTTDEPTDRELRELLKLIHRCPTYYQLEDGSIRICFGDVCGTVSSWHLVPPKV